MKKILVAFLLFSFLLIPTLSYAEYYYYEDEEDSYYDEEDLGLTDALMMEAFVTIHMSVFVLWPFACLIEKENPVMLFWFFFISILQFYVLLKS